MANLNFWEMLICIFTLNANATHCILFLRNAPLGSVYTGPVGTVVYGTAWGCSHCMALTRDQFQKSSKGFVKS